MSFETISSNTCIKDNSIVYADMTTAGANVDIFLPDAQDYTNRLFQIKKKSNAYDLRVFGFIDNFERLNMPANMTLLPYLSVISNGNSWSILNQSNGFTTIDAIAMSNLISHWKLDDESGSTAHDSTENAREGTLSNFVLPTDSIDSKLYKSYSFNGSKYISIGDVDEIELTTISFSFWMRINTTTQDYDFITKGIHTTQQPLLIWFDDAVSATADAGGNNTNTISVLCYDGSTMHWVAGTTNAIIDANWHHICAVLDPDNNEILLYIDGLLNNSNTKNWNGIQTGSQSLRIGTALNNANTLNGSMDDIRIYNKALNALEVQNLYLLGL